MNDTKPPGNSYTSYTLLAMLVIGLLSMFRLLYPDNLHKLVYIATLVVAILTVICALFRNAVAVLVMAIVWILAWLAVCITAYLDYELTVSLVRYPVIWIFQLLSVWYMMLRDYKVMTES